MGKKVILSIDIDMIDYLDHGSEFYNELAVFYPLYKKNILDFFPVKTTWFIRIDSQIEKMFGEPDYNFIENKTIIDELISLNHEIGWHHHAYKQINGKWLQEMDEIKVRNELFKYGKIARRYGIKVCRMGWGYQTNITINALSNLGFRIDSSSIPRPKYKWDLNIMDWEGALTHPYNPSIHNYKVNGEYCLPILEVPITTSFLKATYDTQNVIRYVNPSYHHNKFIEAYNSISNKELICMIMHPYESMSNIGKHDLLSFSFEDLRNNISFLLNENFEFISFDDLLLPRGNSI